jgi:hypothetical protein
LAIIIKAESTGHENSIDGQVRLDSFLFQ